MPARRTRGDGGLTQRHDHKSCPPPGSGPPDPETGKPTRAEHKCRGRWQGTVPVAPGSSRKKYVYGATKDEARAKLRDAVAQRDSGSLVVTNITVESWLRHWLNEIAYTGGADGIKPGTYRAYQQKINAYLVPHIGRHRLTTLQPEHVRLMYREMREAGLAEASLRQTHAVLARALKVAMQEGKLLRNPMASVKPPSTKTAKVPRLTMAQARQVLAHTDHARWWLAVFYGMRQGEVLGLRWCDVDLQLDHQPGQQGEAGMPALYVVQTLQKDTDGKPIFGPPKSDAGERTVPLIPVMAARLKLAHAAAGSPPAGPNGGSEELVFPGRGRNGEPRPMDTRKDWASWRELLEAASTKESPLPAVSLHSARNTAASLLEAAGVPPRLVGQIIGHANIKQTEHYQHAEMERMFAALASGASLLDLTDLPELDPPVLENTNTTT